MNVESSEGIYESMAIESLFERVLSSRSHL